MFLSIATTHRPATDLGFLLMKHPERVHAVELSFGTGTVLFPEASEERCEAALVLDVDPVGLVRGRGRSEGLLDQYVNDRPYAASSFLSVALNRAFRTAMAGSSRERQNLADTAIPLEIRVTPLPVRGGETLLAELFEPLGWTIEAVRLVGPSGPSRYVDLVLRGTLRLADALSHLYVLLPALDADKHYWVGADEVDKLLAKGGAWLGAHPAREEIARRYLRRRRDLVAEALARLAPEDEPVEAAEEEAQTPAREAAIEAPLRLHELRLDTVAEALAASGAKTVADLGCGEGKLLRRLARDRRYEKLIGLDASTRVLERAAASLRLRDPGGDDRIVLLHGALTYRDERWHGVDAAALVEVIEHLDPDRLAALEAVVFGEARPATVIVTTPNAEYNRLFPGLAAGAMRHPDHRFEWTRAEFAAWAAEVAERHGYAAALSGIGDADPSLGPPSQMAVFSR